MAGHKRFLAAIVATAAVTAATMTFAAPGKAAPYVKAPELSVSTSAPCKSTSMTVTGTGFVPGSTVGLTLQPGATSLGSVVASATGEFTKTVTLPEVVGTFQLVASGPSTPTNPNTAEVTLNIRSCVGPVPITGYTGGPHGGTGYALPAGLAALACLTLGGALVWWRRHRKHAA